MTNKEKINKLHYFDEIYNFLQNEGDKMEIDEN